MRARERAIVAIPLSAVAALLVASSAQALAPCESLYAAELAELSDTQCDTPIPTGRERSHSEWGCLDGQSPNQCARHQYQNPTVHRNLPRKREFRLHYLPMCIDGSNDCPGEEVRCTDGTRPAVYIAPAHDAGHAHVDSTQWMIRMGGEGDPCGGDILDSDGNYTGAYNCWDWYHNSGGDHDPTKRRSISSKVPSYASGPDQFNQYNGVYSRTSTFGNGSANPWHGVNRVNFERCSSWSGDQEQIIHPTQTPASNYRFEPATVPGATVVYHHGERIAKTLFRYLESLGYLEPTHVVLAGSSDGSIGLSYAADELAEAIYARHPDTWVGIVLDSYFTPIFEGEAAFNANGADSRGTNRAPDTDSLYDHFGNPLGENTPLAYRGKGKVRRILRLLRRMGIAISPAELDALVRPPYSTAAYEPGGEERLRIDDYGWDLDQSCVDAASHGALPGDSACYDHQHVFLNHLETPLFLIADMDDSLVGTLGRWHGFYWTEAFFSRSWKRSDFKRRVQHQAITVAEQSPVPVGLFVSNWHVHTTLTNKNASRYACLVDRGAVVRTPTIATALFEWMNDPAASVPMIAEYSPAPGSIWHDQWSPSSGRCRD